MSSKDIERALIEQSGVLAYLPDFSFAHVHDLDRLVVTREPGAEQPTIELVARVGDGADVVITLRLLGARGTLPDLRPWFGLGELLIDDLSADQLEGVRYGVHDEGGAMRVYCRTIELSAERIPPRLVH